MSYDLCFWRYIDETAQGIGKKPEYLHLYRDLMSDQVPEGMGALAVDEISAAITSAMAVVQEWTLDGVMVWVKEPSGVIEAYVHEFYVSFSLRGAWSGDDVNRLIDVMKPFGCPLFDPQTGERFSL